MSKIPPFYLPKVEGLCLEELVVEEEEICITVSTTAAQVPCPVCGVLSSRVQSRYHRSVVDLTWAGLSVRLLLHVRRFRCDNADCPRAIFCERLGPAIAAYARRTQRLDTLLQCIAVALGGEAGARLGWQLGMATSPTTLLRLIRQMGEAKRPTPRVLGVDDWAWRRGQRYGTLLCDLESHRVVDLLPDRRAETFAAWLLAHPGVEVISRDRAGNYAEGGRLGAPKAIQVADRWHLIQNVAEALDPVLRRLQRSLKPSRSAEGQEKKSSKPELHLTPAQQERREQLQISYRRVQPLYEQGRSLREIAKMVGIDTNTLRYFVQGQPWAVAHRGRKSGEASLEAHLPYLHKRWRAGCQNGLQLWRELQARGYTGSASSVKPYIALLRQVPDDLLPPAFSRQPKSEKEEAFSVRRILWLTLSRPEQRTEEQAQEVAQVAAFSTPVATALTLAQEFVKVLREKNVEALPAWLTKAQKSSVPELRQLANGIERDRAAVEAALSRPESNGQTEGHVNRLKLIKREMYGRAKFDLLRSRVLHAA